MNAKRMCALALVWALLLSACALVCHADHLCDDPACCPVCLQLSGTGSSLSARHFCSFCYRFCAFFCRLSQRFVPCPARIRSSPSA